MKFILVLCLAFIAIANAFPGCPGCPSEVEGENLKDVEKILNYSLVTGDKKTPYTIIKIISATTQVVAGSKKVITAELKDEDGNVKTCKIEIWSQPWIKTDEAVEVTIDCPGVEKLTKKHKAYEE